MGGLVSEVGSLFGGAPNNAQYQAQGTNVLNPATADQYTQALAASQGALGQQQGLINALNSQNGIGNQNQVYGQLQGVANGTGPNPAAAMLNQATGQNVAAQGALAAGQRGAGANVGLIERQAAQQGANTQQQAIGQGATLQANQSLNALGQLGGIANTQAANQIGAVGNYNSAAQGLQGQIGNQINAQNSANVGLQSNINNANQAMASTNANNSAKAIGGLTAGIGTALGLGASGGGGGGNLMASSAPGAAFVPAPASSFGPISGYAQGGQVKYPEHLAHVHKIYHGAESPNPKIGAVAPSDRYPGAAQTPQHMTPMKKPENFKAGREVPGKPKQNKDTPSNDTVEAKLTPEEIVLPLSVTQAKNAPEAAAKFVADTLRKKGKGDPKKDFKEALKRSVLERKSA